MDIQSLYQRAIKFAALKHLDQTVPGTDLPYLVHLSNVSMEILIAAQNTPGFDIGFSVQVALLHDTQEDTDTTFQELSDHFGSDIAHGVLALTKNKELPKSERMADSLKRIRSQRKEVWMVKLADRITNLQQPPNHWNTTKKVAYQQEAIKILKVLQGGNPYLEKRLSEKIVEYKKYTV